MIDVYISHAREDADWAGSLADRLLASGLTVHLDQWSVLPGDVIVHALDEAIRTSRSGIAVVSSASLRSRQAMDEYAALVTASGRGGLRFIPVVIDNVDLPPMAGERTWRSFHGLDRQEYEERVRELVTAIRGRGPTGYAPPRENLDAGMPSGVVPLPASGDRTFVVCYTADDAEYGAKLAAQLRDVGLPVWSLGDLLPGDTQFRKIRQHLRDAVAVVVVMSPQSQDSDDITRMILEGMRHGHPFFPVLLHGEPNYHLATTWYVDARDGRFLRGDELDLLHRLHRGHDSGRPLTAADVLPRPLADPPVRAVRVPAAASLRRLDGFLREREYAHADLLTTAMLLEAAGRLHEGWLRERHGADLPLALLSGTDALWAEHTAGRQGFRAQASLARVSTGRTSEFLALSLAYGWRDSVDDSVPGHYPRFADRAGPGTRAGFFPTLRNPQTERSPDWYDQWTATVLAVHLRLHDWGN